jgi:A/G-specific adenine glycosylase
MDLICPKAPADFNQAIMELGALICRPKNPACHKCPLSGQCRANRHHTTSTYPKRDAPRKVPTRHVAIGVILKKGKMLVVQREMEGFLGGLWEFPAVPASAKQTGREGIEAMIAVETGLTIAVNRRLTRIRHAYTHFRLSGDIYLCRYVAGRVRLKSAQSHRWVTLRSLNRLPLHKANHKFLDALKTALSETKN